MQDRREFEMTESDLKELLEACRPVPYMVFGGRPPSSPAENASRVWDRLGVRLGFVRQTARPIDGKGQRFFTAVPVSALDGAEDGK